jgi:hypothetical protein
VSVPLRAGLRPDARHLRAVQAPDAARGHSWWWTGRTAVSVGSTEKAPIAVRVIQRRSLITEGASPALSSIELICM